ncbi:MAG: PKD domain-containing protein [Candidatus Peribacteria bacterium]|jgi:PKD repeat protein|nr:PKD domain-containing protein [Candidatus Peribacteria bacterium]
MQTKTQRITFLTLLIGLFTAFLALPALAADDVPLEYYANHEIQTELGKIQDIFVQLDAAKKSGKTDKLSSDLFTKLHSNFGTVFSAFPQEYNFKVVYQQCLDGTETLAAANTLLNFQSFMDNCYTPLSKLINTINTQYTVKVSATKNPGNGAAPLTVTFSARGSKDPSNETIPTRNFFRYYRDTKGIFRPIGVGEVINYTFEESGNYVVHLTVRSSNHSKGILDGEMDLNVDVEPKAANIVVYANTKQLDKTRPTKIGTQEAQKGVIFDGSPTMPTGGRRILRHARTITSRDGFKRSREFDGVPRYINVPLNGNGEYLIKLATTDNETNTVSETFSLTVSDPVAIIKQTPDEGNTSTTFSFDSSASYSLTARLKLYTWEIFDSNGTKTDTIQGKSIKKQFTKPGNYMVKLTLEDELGETNVDTKELYVESSTPVPQFTITPTNKRAQASEFHLDATSSADLDVTNQNDSLEYRWEFSNPNVSKVISTTENNKKVVVQFDEIGQHTIKLTVIDMYGKSASIEKSVNVTSILRPELTVNPNAITRGKNVEFSVQTNKPIINYQWNFGDSTTNSNQSNQMQHIYRQI